MSNNVHNVAQTTISVVCVVESSLALAAEWNRILMDYLSPMLKRLGESNVGSRFRMAFVTYATADAQPSPLLAKRFFADLQVVTKELREDPGKLGIGQTSSGGARGMAALEGLVAAIELFDILHRGRHKSGAKPNTSHIFHIAASPADNAEHPCWNSNSSLDSTSWQTLPDELTKREINLSIINLKQLTQFSNLYNLTSKGLSEAAWFPTRSPHCVYLSGFPTAQKSLKRSPGRIADKGPDQKRPRHERTPSDALRKAQPAPPPPPSSSAQKSSPPVTVQQSPPKQPPIEPQVQPQRPTQHQFHPPSQVVSPRNAMEQNHPHPQSAESLVHSSPPVPQPPTLQLTPRPQPTLIQPQGPSQPQPPIRPPIMIGQIPAQFINHMRGVEAQLRQQREQMIAAQAAGDVERFETIKREHDTLGTTYSKLKAAFLTLKDSTLKAAQQRAAGAGNNVAPSQPSQTSVPQPPSQMMGHSNDSAQRLGLNNESIQAASHSPMHNISPPRQPAMPFQPANPPAPSMAFSSSGMNGTPGLNQQVPMQPTSQARPPFTGANIAFQPAPPPEQQRNRTPQQLPTHAGQSSTMNPAVPQNAAVNPPPVGESSLAKREVWRGPLVWTGLEAGAKKEMHSLVVAINQNSVDCHANTWPQNLVLTPSKEPAVSYQDIHSWIKRTKPALCSFTPQQMSISPSENKPNSDHFRILINLLTERNVFALVAWTTPSGGQTNNGLIFPVNNIGLVGAFFPLTGLPELPKASGAPAPPMPRQPPFPLPPQVFEKLKSLPPAHRDMAINRYMSHIRQQQMARQQQIQQSQQSQQQQQSQGNQPPLPSTNVNAFPMAMQASISGGGGMPSNMPGGMMPNGWNTQDPTMAMNLMNMNAQLQQAQAQQAQAQARARAANGAVGGNMLSYEMMQSFMQRKPGE